MKNNSNKAYYHISPIVNKENVLLEGLKSECKQIFVSDCQEQLIMIASCQIHTRDYSVFEILPSGITERITSDDAQDISSHHQLIVNQDLISPEHIIHLRDEKWNFWDLAEYNLRVTYSLIELDVEDMLEFNIKTNEDWCSHYNSKYGKNIQFIGNKSK
jgi:hypothetical protein